MAWIIIVDSMNRCNIDSHDYSVRLRAAEKFLKDGDKVCGIYFLNNVNGSFSCSLFLFAPHCDL